MQALQELTKPILKITKVKLQKDLDYIYDFFKNGKQYINENYNKEKWGDKIIETTL